MPVCLPKRARCAMSSLRFRCMVFRKPEFVGGHRAMCLFADVAKASGAGSAGDLDDAALTELRARFYLRDVRGSLAIVRNRLGLTPAILLISLLHPSPGLALAIPPRRPRSAIYDLSRAIDNPAFSTGLLAVSALKRCARPLACATIPP